MVIDTNNGVTANSGSFRSKGSTGVAHNGDHSTTGNSGDQSGTDSVSLSSEAQILARLEAKINAASDVDSDRIAVIKQAIENGTYEINAEHIAGRMLDQDDLLA